MKPSQLQLIQAVAAAYWEQAPEDILDSLKELKIIKSTGGKIMGTLPRCGDKASVCFKIYFYDRGFQFESRGLQAANALPPINGIKVPGIEKILPEYRAVLMENRDWDNDPTDLQKFFVGSLGIDWVKVGRWLRAFHDSHTSHEKSDLFLRKKFHNASSRLQELSALFSAGHTEKMRQIILSAQEYFETEEIEWVLSHGDFGLSNIKILGDTLEVIDFEDCQMAPRSFDVINCLTRLEYARYFPNLPATFSRICSDFMQGYGMTFKENIEKQFFYLLIKLDLLESYHRRNHSDKVPHGKRMIFRLFEKKLLNDIQDFL